MSNTLFDLELGLSFLKFVFEKSHIVFKPLSKSLASAFLLLTDQCKLIAKLLLNSFFS